MSKLDIESYKKVQKDFDRKFLSLPIWQVPEDSQLIYNPLRPCSFAPIGEQMVEAVLKHSTKMRPTFDAILPFEIQRKYWEETFLSSKWALKDKKEKDPNYRTRKGKDFFETKRKFEGFLLFAYKRTEAPRLTAQGSGCFHGLKKKMKYTIIKNWPAHFTFLDLDMSACHLRVGERLLKNDNSACTRAVHEESFWNTSAKQAQMYFRTAGLYENTASIRASLKVATYTSLNGGNPSSPYRIFENAIFNFSENIGNVQTADLFLQTALCKAMQKTFENFPVINELKNLNKGCAQPLTYGPDGKPTKSGCYTPDRLEMEIFEKPHLGISRVLQGFEIILLCCLYWEMVDLRLQVCSLDHDGLLAYLPTKDYKKLCSLIVSSAGQVFDSVEKREKVGAYYLSHLISSTGKGGQFGAWWKYLLNTTIPVEPKLLKTGKTFYKF